MLMRYRYRVLSGYRQSVMTAVFQGLGYYPSPSPVRRRRFFATDITFETNREVDEQARGIVAMFPGTSILRTEITEGIAEGA
jgi:hypothetical protein